MEIITIECPKCKGRLHVEEGTDKLFCMYCRAEVLLKPKLKEESYTTNHEFKAKLAIAKHNEELHRKHQMTFEKVLESYDEVREIGAHHWEYWDARASFLAKAGSRRARRNDRRIKAEKTGAYRVLGCRKTFLDTYSLWMDSAIRCVDGDAKKLTEKKEKQIQELTEKLSEVKEFSPGSGELFVRRPKTAQEEKSDENAAIILWIVGGVAVVIWAAISL